MSRGKRAQDLSECIKVAVRCRPIDDEEVKDGFSSVVNVDVRSGAISLAVDEPTSTFTFDNVFEAGAPQKRVYDEIARPVVAATMEGFSGTIFAYGQTGTGKTFTMDGGPVGEARGIIPNAFEHIFSEISGAAATTTFLVRFCAMEIYMEEVRDLLAARDKFSKKLAIRQDPTRGVFVQGLKEYEVRSVEQIANFMETAKANRKTGETKMNPRSSRSHAIYTVIVECAQPGLDGKMAVRTGRLNLVDLAGSEDVRKAEVDGQRFDEAKMINKSLTMLNRVLQALSTHSSFIPYRDSVLTRLLQSSLGGNSKTVMIANIGPADKNWKETVSTLRYAHAAKAIVNKPTVNANPQDAMLLAYQQEIEALKAQLGGAPGANQEEFAAEMERMRRDAEQREQRAASELSERDAALLAERDARAALAQRLSEMEQRLLVGGEELVAVSDRAARALAEQQTRYEQQMRDEERNRARVQEEALLAIKQFGTLQEEAEVKTKQLKKLWRKLKEMEAEKEGLEYQLGQLTADMGLEISNLTRENKRLQAIVNRFVPADEVERINARLIWDEDLNEYKMGPAPPFGRIARPATTTGAGREGSRRMTRQALTAVDNQENRMRYQGENILKLQFDPYESRLQGERPARRVSYQTQLDAATRAEGATVIRARDNLPTIFKSYAS